MFQVQYQNKRIFECNILSYPDLVHNLSSQIRDFYLVCNGKRVEEDDLVQPMQVVHVVPRLPGGKGGFGSMLRAIGAQIEKTTNREACRDLSGRRLRDINEEKRVKAWIDKQADREREADENKRKKLEKLMRTPNVEFKDEVYEKERASLPERVEDAITQGLREAEASEDSKKTEKSLKRKAIHAESSQTKKKKALWIEDGLEISTSDDESDDSDANISEEKPTLLQVKNQ